MEKNLSGDIQTNKTPQLDNAGLCENFYENALWRKPIVLQSSEFQDLITLILALKPIKPF